jgi:hypothetical protein
MIDLSRRVISITALLLLAAVALGACSPTERPTAEDQLATTVAQTLTARSVQPTQVVTPEPPAPPVEQLVKAWLGHVVGLPSGSQFDDYLALIPEGIGEVGIEGANAEVEAEIMTLRDREGVGEYVHVWGTINCDMLDFNGCQLLVNKLRYGQTLYDPDPVDGWEGTITTSTFNMDLSNVFVLAGDFPMWYSIDSTDPAIRDRLESLRDTGIVIRVWGELMAGIPDVNGTRIQATRVEIEGEPVATATGISAEDEYVGWKTYTNETIGYTLKYPGNARIMGADLNQLVTFEGPLSENEYWPLLFVDHYNSEFYHPPDGTNVEQWVLDSGTTYDDIGSELRIAGLPTLHLIYNESPQAYGSDHYYFIKGEQLFHIQILHADGRQDWDLYQRFVRSFAFIPPVSQPGSLTDAANFVADVTVPDGAAFNPGKTFVKTWRLRNSGETTWTTDYNMIFDKGDQMDGPDTVNIPGLVPPGQTVDISVELSAPDEEGRYKGYWMLRNANGVLFGIGPDSTQPIFVDIYVVKPGSGTPTPTPLPEGSNVTDATLRVDRSHYKGICPITFTFTGTIFSQGAGSFVYELVADSSSIAFEFFLPAPQIASFTAGGENRLDVSYWLEILDSVEGRARLYISAPNTFRSDWVNFTAICE